MAQTDAMETAKEVLRQIIKYRFWISVSVAALFAVIAYMVGSGPIQAAAAKETSAIKAAETEVKNYASNAIPTKDYKPIVEEKTVVLSKDVIAAWRELYDRQAPLLTWPEGVQERFQSWGRQWPDKVHPTAIELAKVEYIEAYPAYVDMVYKTFNPFNYETGEGIVAAPSEAELLLPAQFSQEHLPDLGKIWAAQERLWIQRTVLEVIAEVNKNVKKWDDAVIRQLVSLQVGSLDAQDQRSLAKNEQLEESKGIYAPGEEPAATDAGGGSATGSMLPGMGSSSRRGFGDMGGGGMMGGMMGGGQAPESVFYVKGESDKYKILPLAVEVLIEQDRVQDFLIELENSPMWIQVKDFELIRPSSRVSKPEKGEMGSGFMGMGTMMGGGMMGGRGGMMGMMQGMTGMGGQAGMMEQQMRSMMQQGQRGMMGQMQGLGGGGMGAPSQRKQGKDVRSIDRKDERNKAGKAVEDAKGPSLFDPYFNIVLVKVYGQARFFNAPPAEPAAEPSQSAAAAAPGEPAAKGGETKAAAAPTAKSDEKAGTTKAADQGAALPKDAGAAAKPATAPDAESKPEKAAGKDSGDEPAKPANPAAPAAKTGPAEGKAAESKP